MTFMSFHGACQSGLGICGPRPLRTMSAFPPFSLYKAICIPPAAPPFSPSSPPCDAITSLCTCGTGRGVSAEDG